MFPVMVRGGNDINLTRAVMRHVSVGNTQHYLNVGEDEVRAIPTISG